MEFERSNKQWHRFKTRRLMQAEVTLRRKECNPLILNPIPDICSDETRARTWDWPRTRRYGDLSNDPDPSSPRQFCPGCLIATREYDFREGHLAALRQGHAARHAIRGRSYLPRVRGVKLPSRNPSDWVPVPSGGLIDTTLHDNNANNTKTLSITNIYKSVRQSPDGSVLEVSFFSHAFVRGPVLINTSDDPSSPKSSG